MTVVVLFMELRPKGHGIHGFSSAIIVPKRYYHCTLWVPGYGK